MINFFTICLFLLPWIFLPAKNLYDPYRLPKETFFDIICLGMIALSFLKLPKLIYKNKYISWFSIWVFFTMFMNWFMPYMVRINSRWAVHLWTIEPSIHFILGLWLTYIALTNFTKEDYIKIAKTICLSAVLITAFGIMQIMKLEPFGVLVQYNHPNHFCALLDNPNIVGDYLCVSLPFFMYFNETKYILGGLFVLLGILFSKSILAIGAAFLIITFFLFYREQTRKRLIVLYAILLGLIIFYLKSNIQILKFYNNFSGRLDLWKQAWMYFKHNPLCGQGLGIFKTWETKEIAINTVWSVVHNDWLERAIEIGIAGIILMCLILFNSFRKFNYRKENRLGLCYLCSFIIFLLIMAGSFTVETIVAMLGLIGFWGVEALG